MPLEAFEIREARASSVDAKLLIQALSEELAQLYDHSDDGSGNFNTEKRAEERSLFFIGYLGHQPVACGAIVPFDDKTGEIKRMFVTQGSRGKGIAKRILSHLEEAAWKQGFQRLILETGNRQTEALALYRSSGFQPRERYGIYIDSERSLCFQKERPDFLRGLGDFSQQADAYQKARPGYPQELLTQLIEVFQLCPGNTVTDIGAGTGLLTQHLAEFGFKVSAIEPSQEMRELAPTLLNTRWIDATFEKTTLNSNSQDWVVAAQAFHWAKPQVALPEIRRILKPERPLTCFWNNRRNDESEALSWVMEAITRYVPEFDHHYRKDNWSETLVSTGDFKEVKYHGVDHSIRMSKDRFRDLWRSHNRLNTQAGPKVMEEFLNELTEFINSRYPGDIDVPYRCDAWSVI